MTAHFRSFWLKVLILFVLLLGLLGGAPAHAAPLSTTCSSAITVTSNADAGAGSLRQAIADICAGGTITFDSDYTITLTSGELGTSIDMTIDGGSHTVIVDGNAASRVFHITSGTLNLKHLTIQNGQADNGGGIDNAGTLTVTNCTVSGNAVRWNGGGISNEYGNTLTVTSSTVSDNTVGDGGNGIGIYNGYGSTLTVTDSLISGNHAAFGNGGGIYSDLASTLTVTGSTISGNTGGGIDNSGSTVTITDSTISGNTSQIGGGIDNWGKLTVTHSTISGNTATNGSGGGIKNTGTLTLSNSTISGNRATYGPGGGIENKGTLTSKNNTVASNSASSFGGGIYSPDGTTFLNNTLLAGNSSRNCSGTFTDNGYNLDDGDTCNFRATGSKHNADPMLGALAGNGGSTQTMALGTDSAAIDAGNDTVCSEAASVNGLDQRATTRPQGTHCDIGAYEYVFPVSVSTFAATSSSTSLNIPITAFTPNVTLPPAASYLITTSSARPLSTDSGWSASAPATFTVASSGSYTLYPWVKAASGDVSMVYASPASVTVCLSAITVTNNADSGAGSLRQAISDACPGGTLTFQKDTTITLTSGELLLDKNLTIDGGSHAIILDGHAASKVIEVSFSTVSLKHLTIQNGKAIYGAGIYNYFGTLTVTDSTISGNTATSGPGGGIYNLGGTLTLTNSTISGNTAASGGGGIANYGTLTATNSTISGNTLTGGSGGGIYNEGTLTAANSTIAGNTSSGSGGGIQTTEAVNFYNTLLAGNTGGNCAGSITDGGHNLDDGSTCGFSAANLSLNSADPKLGALAGNGGPTQTLALGSGSAAIDAGDNSVCSNAASVNSLDQRGVARPQGVRCDIGAFELDQTAPSVTSFTAISSTSNLAIPITAFTASDNLVVTGYLITTSATPPDATAATWSSTVPGTYTVAGTGHYMLYPWAKDPDGNVSVLYGSPASVIVCTGSSFTVTNNADAGAGSLRQAISDLCSGGTISFQNDTTITLTSGELLLDKDMTIDGGSHTIVVDGNTASRVFHISSARVSLKHLTIQNGKTDYGAGIYSYLGNLTVTDSTISGNTATNGSGGGIYNQAGTLTITNSTISGNTAFQGFGGGIISYYNELTITSSTISGNSVDWSGGGIANFSFLTLTNSTVSGNTAVSGPGGGGIFNNRTLLATNSTIAGNTASDYGGGIYGYTSGQDYLYNTILAGNTGGNCAGSISDGGHNLDDGSTCGFSAAGSLNSADPKLGALASNGGPTQTLALGSGSAAIDAGNDTVCSNAASVKNLDQRGVARPQGAHCDIGAFELAPIGVKTFSATSPSLSLAIPITAFTANLSLPAASAYLITSSSTQPLSTDGGWNNSAPGTYTVADTGAYTLYPWVKDASGNVSPVYASPAAVIVCAGSAFTVTNNADSGAGSLRKAVQDLCSGGTISFQNDTSITLTSGELLIDKDMIIDGGSHKIVVDGNAASRVFNITSAGVSLKHLTIQNGWAAIGAGIRNAGTLTLNSSTISGNTATTGPGGGINNSGKLMIINSTLAGNAAASGPGGGIENSGTLTSTNVTISGNSASGSGGGIDASAAVNLYNTLLAGNTGGNCAGSITDGGHNLDDGGTCGFSAAGSLNAADPKLGALADNGGPTDTMALGSGSAAIDAGDDTVCSDATTVNNLDQRGVARPHGAHCDIGAFELFIPLGVKTFSATSPSTSLSIPIPAFTPNDSTPPASAYLITVSNTQPLSTDGGWSSSVPATYLVPDTGSYNLYPWVKDASGNVSPVYASPLSVLVCAGWAPTVTNNADSGADSLRQAIKDACPGSTVTFDKDTTITLTSGELLIDKDLTIDGGSHKIVVDGNAASRVFNINSSTVSLNSLTIQNGKADHGAGIYNDYGLLTITNSTISGNTATGGMGGGINNHNGTLRTINNTISGNTASLGGGIYNYGELIAKSSTLAGNTASDYGGGIVTRTGIHFSNMLLAANTGGNCDGPIADDGYNLDDGSTCGVGPSYYSLNNVDPKLGPLADNGGPTKTLALGSDSPAIDAGYDTVCSDVTTVNNLDQRGVTRPQGDHCDIGAYEYVSPVSVNTFTATSPSTSLNIPITAFTPTLTAPPAASYLITTSSARPLSTDSGWSASVPATFTVAGFGAYTLYPWVKSAAGDVSFRFANPASVIVCRSDITVTNANDSGAGSLRQAISSVCPGGTITFQNDTSITLTSDELFIPNSLTIDGGSHKVVLDGNAALRVIHITGGTVNLKHLTIQNGYAISRSGGIYVEFDPSVKVAISNSLISDNNSGGIYNEGTLTISSSTISGNTDNGGIINEGTLTVTDSTISGNTSAYGVGGLSNNYGDTLTVTNSTISGNTSAYGVGGIESSGTATITGSTISGNTSTYSNGGIQNLSIMTITDSTISGNTTRQNGGGFYNSGTLTVTNSTIAGNTADLEGSGIYSAYGTATFHNSLLAANPGRNCAGAITDGGHNLDSGNTCTFSPDNGSLRSADPNLGALADNGGPTQSMALLSGSAAIDAGDDAVCSDAASVNSLDQRGISRPQGGHCDIGAYEANPLGIKAFKAASVNTSLSIPITALAPNDSDPAATAYIITSSSAQPLSADGAWSGTAPSTFTVAGTGLYTLYPWAKDGSGNVSSVYTNPAVVIVCSSSAITVTSNADSGAGSLRQAISNVCPGGTISFQNDTTISLTSGELLLVKDLTIDGGSHVIIVDGSAASSVFHITHGAASLMHLTIRNGKADNGGGILNGSSLTLTNSTVSGNTSVGNGGGIYNDQGVTLALTNSTISGNTVGDGSAGGGIYNYYGSTLTVTNSAISGNHAPYGSGGGTTIILAAR